MTSEKKIKPKLKRKFISLQQKIDILDQLNNGKKSTAIARDLGLNESTIRTILQNESKIRNAVMYRSLQTLSKSSRIKDSLIPKTEKCLMIWIEDCNKKNIPLNNCLIKAKAQKIFTHLKELETNSSDKSKLKFVSSNGWFERFRKRFSLHNIQIQGESASADYERERERFKEEVPDLTDGGGYKAEDLDEEELVQLADTDASVINSAEESLAQSTDEVEETVCIENLNKIVELGKQLELLVANCDSCMERTTEFKINLQHCLAPYVDMQNNHKIPKEESFDTEIIIKVEPEEVLIS